MTNPKESSKLNTMCSVRDKLFILARENKLSHAELAAFVSMATGLSVSRSSVAAWSRGSRDIGEAREKLIKERLGI